VPPKRSQSTKFQNFHFFARPLCQNASQQRLRTGFILHPTGPASERPYAFEGGLLNFGPRPPGRPTPQKVFPKFRKNLRGGGQFFECAKRGPPRAVRDKILATVPWPIFAEKNSEFSPKIDFLSSYENVAHAKKVVAMRA